MAESIHIEITNSSSIVGFEKAGGGSREVWDRYLTIEGKQAYHIGNICRTCSFFFQRLEGANRSIPDTEIADRLNKGTDFSEPEFITTLSQILPNGSYCISFPTTRPVLAVPGSSNDYFVREQVELWGIDSFWGLPYHPRVAYYRGRSLFLGEHRQLYEFLIPMFPYTWLNKDRVALYGQEMTHGVQPAGLVLSVLDIKQPDGWEGDPAITEHWCLAHYLLDGHHKTYTAAQMQLPIKLVSFLALNESLASPEQIEHIISSLT